MVVVNFSGQIYENLPIGVPRPGAWHVRFHSGVGTLIEVIWLTNDLHGSFQFVFCPCQ